MEDLAYIYLALNEESECSGRSLDAPPSQYSLSNWAPPLDDDHLSDVSTLPSVDALAGAPKVHAVDADFDPHSCPSCFYL